MFEPNEYTSTSKTCICCPVVDTIFTFFALVTSQSVGLEVKAGDEEGLVDKERLGDVEGDTEIGAFVGGVG
jgi:hypothetical protein